MTQAVFKCNIGIGNRWISTSPLEGWKRRSSSGEREKIICERFHRYYASVEEHQRKNVPWNAWLFTCLHILSMTCYSLKIVGLFVWSHIHLSVYSACYFTKTGLNLLSFWWFQNLAVHTNTYMLVDIALIF